MLTKVRNEGRAEGFVLGALLGVAVATILSLLFAPKAGEDLRKDISEGTNKTLKQADDYLDTAKKKGTEMVDSVEESASKYLKLADNKSDGALSKAKDLFARKAAQAEKTTEDAKTALQDKYNPDGQKYNTYQYKS